MAPSNFFTRFRTKLLVMVLLLVVPAFGLVLYGNLEQRRIERAAVREAAIGTSRLAAITQKSFVENTRQLLTTLTQFPFLLLATNKSFCEEHFGNLRRLSPDYINFGLIETNGDLFCSAEATNLAVNFSDRLYFQGAMQTKKFALGDYQVGRLTGIPTLSFGLPVFDERGQLRRVLYASLKLSRMSEVLKDISLPPDSTITVYDRLGTVLARFPDPESRVGKQHSDMPVVQRILTSPTETFEMPGIDGVQRLYAVTPISEGQSARLLVSVGIPVAVSYAHANQALIRNCAILGFVVVVVLIGVLFYARRFFLRPVNALDHAAHGLADGNLASRVGAIQGPAELIQLGETFDNMAERLQKRQAEVAEAQQQITKLNLDLERRVVERTEQVETAKRELEAFSYSVSHDLRAPLRHITGFADMIAKEEGEKLSDRGRRFLKTIGDSGKQMGNLVDALLAFIRMGRTELQIEDLDLNILVQDAIANLRTELTGRSVVWKNSPLPHVQADNSMMRHVFTNLIGNAVKFSRGRNPAEIEIGCSAESPTEHILFIRDNGVGFDMQYVEKLFGVFHRLHHTDEFEGIGVGLANVRRIIHRHGGRTWAEGRLNGGATFYFSLPKSPQPQAS